MEYYMAIKETEILPCAATWMALDIIKQSEVGQRKTNIIRCHLYVEPKKKYKCIYIQIRNRFTDMENQLTVT